MALNASQTKPNINIRTENALEEKALTLRQEKSTNMKIQQCLSQYLVINLAHSGIPQKGRKSHHWIPTTRTHNMSTIIYQHSIQLLTQLQEAQSNEVKLQHLRI